MEIDARGVSCPQPVLMTKKALEGSPKELKVIVDNSTAKQNVERFMKNSGYHVSITQNEDDYILSAGK